MNKLCLLMHVELPCWCWNGTLVGSTEKLQTDFNTCVNDRRVCVELVLASVMSSSWPLCKTIRTSAAKSFKSWSYWKREATRISMKEPFIEDTLWIDLRMGARHIALVGRAQGIHCFCVRVGAGLAFGIFGAQFPKTSKLPKTSKRPKASKQLRCWALELKVP